VCVQISGEQAIGQFGGLLSGQRLVLGVHHGDAVLAGDGGAACRCSRPILLLHGELMGGAERGDQVGVGS